MALSLEDVEAVFLRELTSEPIALARRRNGR